MEKRKTVVVIGAGFGGLGVTKQLANEPVDVILIDRTNHHLFQPLLYQVATAALSPADIACASRSIFGAAENVSVLLDEVTGVDTARSEVKTRRTGPVKYDYLVLATGAEYGYYGRDDWEASTQSLKTLNDALTIREQLLSAFEEAERTSDEAQISRLLTFAVIGGGPTGVEMAGAIAELAKTMLGRDYKRLSFSQVRIVLIEAGPRILAAFTEAQSSYAANALRELGVEVKHHAMVSRIDGRGIQLGLEYIQTQNVLWAAGTRARPAGAWIGADVARNNGVIVDSDCSVPSLPNVFAIGDVASHNTATGKAYPGLAPVAKQQGRYVGRLILARVKEKASPGPFKYRNWGTMAVIGHSRAVADFGWLRVSGFSAWLLWSMVHLWLLVSFRSRLTVYVNWAWSWWTRGRAARLLTRSLSASGPAPKPNPHL